jgi:hypothetical protein
MTTLSFSQVNRMLGFRRQSRREFKRFNLLFVENLSKLADLLKKDPNADHLLLAEIYREQGKFRLALATLKEVTDKRGNAFRLIKRATLLRKRGVFKMS